MKNINNTTIGEDGEPKTKLMDGFAKNLDSLFIANEYLVTPDDFGSLLMVGNDQGDIVRLPPLDDYYDADNLLVKGVPEGTKITVVVIAQSIEIGQIEVQGSGTDGIAGVFNNGTEATGIADGVASGGVQGSFMEFIAKGSISGGGGVSVWFVGNSGGSWGITGS